MIRLVETSVVDRSLAKEGVYLEFEIPLDLEQLQSVLLTHQAEIENHKDTLYFALDIALSSDVLKQDQNNRIAHRISKLLESANSAYQLFEKADNIPEGVVPFRYNLLVVLGAIRSQLNALQSALRSSNSLSISTKSNKRVLPSHLIANLSRQTLSKYDDLAEEIRLFKDKIGFQQLRSREQSRSKYAE
ncbi:hypothetical protein [Candidatus Chloroploca asiatica]|uniref:Uncharacterized protein n=1 Tax=Candidatus Chloroploca asiatica TaxID=1506545 RepID=A0A2H3KWX8_9CHLR|nr:hypothetical protein [Candidatus Chloroploca asiatica]PDV96871.1 hypothetical protein A9Q02_20035 [Candidatus Chloroploca asiatica]